MGALSLELEDIHKSFSSLLFESVALLCTCTSPDIVGTLYFLRSPDIVGHCRSPPLQVDGYCRSLNPDTLTLNPQP